MDLASYVRDGFVDWCYSFRDTMGNVCTNINHAKEAAATHIRT